MVVDGHHLADETVRLVWACAGGRVALVTDAMAAAGTAGNGGTFQLGDVEVAVEDGAAPMREDGTLAGTVLTMIEAVRNLHALGVPVRAGGRRGDRGAGPLPRPAATSASSSQARRPTSSCSTTGSRSRPSSARDAAMSWLETELREQPEALARLLERQAEAAREAARLFRRRDIRYLLIASRGSSSNVARYAQYLLGRAHRVPVMFATPSLYTIYGQPPRLDGALVIGISQSGASPDVVAVLAEAREQGRPTLALTNDVESPLAQTAEAVLPLEAGRRAGGRRDEDVRQLARRGRAPLPGIGDDARRGRSSRACPEALAAQIELSLGDPPRSRSTGTRSG